MTRFGSFRSVSRAAGVASGALGLSVLIGWSLNVTALKSVFPGLATMKPNTALGFMLAGASLWLAPSPPGRRPAQLCAALVTLIGGLTLLEYAFGWNVGIDQLLFTDSQTVGGPPGRMALATAVGLLFLGCGLLASSGTRRAAWRVGQVLAIGTALVAVFPLVGYAYGVQSLYSIPSFSSAVALHTAFTFLLAAVGILAIRPDVGVMAALTSDTLGGVMARRLLPFAVAVPLLLGWMRLAGQRAGLYDTEFGTALFALANMVVFTLLVWLNADLLHRTDSRRRQAEEHLRLLNVELEQRVRERTAQLEAANKELEAFSYSVSHDLRAPLRAIDGFSQALVEDYADRLDARGLEYLKRVRAAAQRMAQLIDDLLVLSRVTRAEIRREAVDLSALARSIVADLQRAYPHRRVTFHVAEGLVANGDPRLLRLALENLLDNAWKFTSKQPNAVVEMGVTEHEGRRTYFIRDNGVGFDMAYAHRLFGAFQRLHPATEFEGTGIGLATVQRIIHRHGGRIWAYGAVGQGATFYFTL